MLGVLCSAFLSVSSPSPSYLFESGKVTPSETEYQEQLMENLEDMNEFDVTQILFDYFASVFGGPAVASPSETDYDYGTDNGDVGELVDVISADELISSYAVADGLDSPDVNCTWYHVDINGTEYDLCFSKSDADSLWVSDSGYLYNVGTSDITGRVFDGDVLPADKAYDLVVLGSVLRDNMTDIYENNSFNELRSYYWQGGRKYYNSTWCHIKVLDVSNTYQTSSYLTYIIVFLMGGILLCLLKKSLR